MWGRLSLGAAVLILAAFLINLRFIREDNNAEKLATTTSSMSTSTLALTSSAFENTGVIPAIFTCDASPPAGGSPPLAISGVPENAKSLVLIMDDPDVPKALKPDGVFYHWILFNIPPETKEIPSGASVGVPGANGAGNASYTGPCPPKQYEPSEHRYFFKLSALDTLLQLPAGASKNQVEEAMRGHIIGQTQLVGRYKRP